MNLDAYLANVRRRAKYVKDMGAALSDDWYTVKMQITDYAAELHFQSKRGFVDVFPNAHTDDPYAGAYQKPCPQLTDFACWAVAFCTVHFDRYKWAAYELAYILTGWKSAEQLDWEIAMGEAADERLLRYAY